MNWETPATKREVALAVVFLGLLLNLIFFPVLWGNKTLLTSAWDVPSIMPFGAYYPGSPRPPHIAGQSTQARRPGKMRPGSKTSLRNTGKSTTFLYGILMPLMGPHLQLP